MTAAIFCLLAQTRIDGNSEKITVRTLKSFGL
jgi:hypothetical protein